ncbi:discoidin domain-containing protein [Wocania ichthyoenteri]|uniref:discoidin domain-containing protein n=1 Tax=Wocania ichthyoenteri TaxID=1230531 RepID=UPI00053EF655|nr:discoidin domain-containing protein [Wocania ichthyoenteri]
MKKVIYLFFLLTVFFVEAQNGNQWSQLFLNWNSTQDNGGSGVVRSIRINPSNTSSVLIGAAKAGIWHTNNSGNDYTFVSGNVPEVEWVNEIIYSQQNSQIVYANTDIGVVKSTNGGINWSYTNLRMVKPNKYGSLNWLDVSTTNSNVVYATTDYQGTYTLYKSTDGGNSWVQKYQTSKKIWDMRIKPGTPETVYILEESTSTSWINFKRSTNSGSTFSTINNGFPSDYNIVSHRARIATTPANNNVVYIAIAFNGGGTNDKISFFKSSDSGSSFTKKCCGSSSSPLENAVGSSDFLYEGAHLAQITWNFAFTVSETDENFLACAANKLKISTDGGATWSYDRSGNVVTGNQYDNYQSNNAHKGVHGDHHGLSIVGDHIWNSNDGGVYYSADKGMTVVKDKSDGLGVQELWGYSQSFKNDVMAVGLNHNKICYRDDNVYGGWIAVNGADAMAANVNPIDDQYMYNHPWGHERVKRSLTGKTGHQMQNLGIELGYITLDNLEFHPHQYYTIYGSDYGDRNKTYKLAKSTNNASSWEVIKSFEAERRNAVAVKSSFADANYVYAVVDPNRVIKSTDEGATWTEVNPPASLIGTNALWRLAVSDQNPNHLWVTLRGATNTTKVIKSTDGGVTWSDFSTGLPNQHIYSIIYQRGSDDILYIGTGLGVYYRKNGMSNWALFGSGMPACKAAFMFINYAKGKLRLGTSRGLWENDLIELTAPKANITADRNTFSVNNPTVKFADYSVADIAATYLWSFPGGTPSTSTSERPVVDYSNASGDSFDVTLTVTDSRGTSTQTLTNFVKRIVETSVHYVDSEETVGSDGKAINAIDGVNTTIWHTKWAGGADPQPHEIQLNLGGTFSVSAFTYLPRQDGNTNGRVSQYEVYVSNDPLNWGAAVASGIFANDASLKTVNFTPKNGSYVRFRSLSEVDGKNFTTAAEIDVIKGPASPILSVYYVDSEETVGSDGKAINAIDGANNTIWHTKWAGGSDPQPHEIQLYLDGTFEVEGFTYLPRQDGNVNGRVSQYEIYVSDNPSNWGTAVASGTFANNANLKTVNFTPKTGSYLRFKTLSNVSGTNHTSAAEINVIVGNQSTAKSPSKTSLSIESENNDLIDLKVYPIPFMDTLNIGGFIDNQSKNAHIKLIDINGRTVISKKIDTNNKVSINTSNLSNGIYILEIKTENYKQYKKIVKGYNLLEED